MYMYVVDPGYQKEADSLLTVNRQTLLSDRENVEKARELLRIVSEETDLSPRGLSNSERYIFVMVNKCLHHKWQSYNLDYLLYMYIKGTYLHDYIWLNQGCATFTSSSVELKDL